MKWTRDRRLDRLVMRIWEHTNHCPLGFEKETRWIRKQVERYVRGLKR